jgi:hypothetical protein
MRAEIHLPHRGLTNRQFSLYYRKLYSWQLQISVPIFGTTAIISLMMPRLRALWAMIAAFTHTDNPNAYATSQDFVAEPPRSWMMPHLNVPLKIVRAWQH